MSKNRLEAITDGVVAIILTLLVLDLKTPADATLGSLLAGRDIFFAYVISFIYVVIIWNAHHQLFRHATQISTHVIWANFFWIFWLSLCPFVTSWVGTHIGEFWPEMCYAIVFAMWTFSFAILGALVAKCNPKVHEMRKKDWRNSLSIIINLVLLALVPLFPPIALFGRFLVATLWALPDIFVRKWITPIE